MVPNAGAPVRADPLRPLNLPRPLTVMACDCRPLSLLQHGCQLPVTQTRDEWRIDDEWWRISISRSYYQIILTDNTVHTIYHDLVTDAWYAHSY